MDFGFLFLDPVCQMAYQTWPSSFLLNVYNTSLLIDFFLGFNPFGCFFFAYHLGKSMV